jgi:glucose-1-phosphate thymidylyltransferase
MVYLEQNKLNVTLLSRGSAWFDTGTPESLLEASMFIHSLEKRQGLKICCPEEIAYRLGLIDEFQLKALAAKVSKSSYAKYLLDVIKYVKQKEIANSAIKGVA